MRINSKLDFLFFEGPSKEELKTRDSHVALALALAKFETPAKDENEETRRMMKALKTDK